MLKKEHNRRCERRDMESTQKPFWEETPMKPGDLFQFCYINGHTRDINNKLGIYLGERHLKCNSQVIPNFAVQLFDENTERLCDAGLKRWMIPLEAK